MATAIILTSFSAYGVNGLPPIAGTVYVGASGADAEASPIQVYWDEGLTDPATQPLQTRDGYFLRGSPPFPVRVWSQQDSYSLKMKDSSGAVVVNTTSVKKVRVDDLNARGGSGLLGHRPIGNDGEGVSIQTKLDYLGSYPGEHVNPADAAAGAHSLQFFRAVAAGADARVGPPGKPTYGFGRVGLAKGILHSSNGFEYPSDGLYGLNIEGVNAVSSALTIDSTSGFGLRTTGYDTLHIGDLLLANEANGRQPLPSHTSAGLLLISGTEAVERPGGMLTIDRVSIYGFHTAIKQDTSNTVNGDKTLVTACGLGGQYIYDQGRNKQAIGWTFLNCSARAETAHFKLGGAGELLIVNYTSDVPNTFIAYPESSGNSGSGNYLGSRTTVMSTKLEYQSTSVKLVDASQSLLLTDSGGSNTDLVLREVSIAPGVQVNEATNVIIKVGNATQGSDAIRIKQEGGTIPGVIEHGSAQLGALNRRWSFRDAIKAPDPAAARFLGSGSHPMMEWRANENVPLDQYRGGQAFTGAIDAQKSFLWHHVGQAIINSGVVGVEYGQRFGGQFSIGGFAPKCTIMGLAVFVNGNPSNTDVIVEWFSSPAHGGDGIWLLDNRIGFATIAADARGLVPVVMYDATKWQRTSAGSVYVRITKPGLNQATDGALAVFYYPYMGT